MTYYDILSTPVGWCAAVAAAGSFVRVFPGEPDRACLLRSVALHFPGCRRDAGACREAVLFLGEYFAAGPPARPPHCIDPGPATPFQRAVWDQTALIAFGQVRTYGWIARRLGRPGAARAVGRALGANPLPLIIPCHRVVRGNGSLGGFSATGGAVLKRRLLEHEGIGFDALGRVRSPELGVRRKKRVQR